MVFLSIDICPPFSTFQDIFPDKSTERKILSLIIKCPSEGCEWTGELREKEVRIVFRVPNFPCSLLQIKMKVMIGPFWFLSSINPLFYVRPIAQLVAKTGLVQYLIITLQIRKICFSPKKYIGPFRWGKYSSIFESNLAPLNQGQYSPIS